ncbi:MAG TPA: glycosyltransferase family 2 protein [Longimicrobium sp.]|nr:glycosyltransferase family 2 protein [Longimicrobium sp.]
MPLVSVVIPTYDRLPLLREAVASVRAQTFGGWELVVADDGSTDGTAEAMEALGDPRVRVVRLPHAGRPSIARNAGIRAARGEWVAFLDSDDVWEPRKLEVQLAALREAGAEWSYTALEMMDEAGRTVPFRAWTFRPLSGMIVRALLREETAATMSTLMVRRSLLEAVRGSDETLHRRDDVDLTLRLAARAPAAGVGQVLTRMRVHAGRITAAIDTPHEATLQPFLRFLAREADPELREIARRKCAELLVSGAVFQAARRRRWKAARLLAASLRYRPAAGRWLRAAVSVGLRAAGLR